MHRLKKVTEQDRYGNKVIKEYEVDQKALDPTMLHAKKMEMGIPEMPGAPPVAGEEFNMGNPSNHPGKPIGEDTVPAWLTPGEFVVNKEATQAFGPQIEAMNNVGRAIKASDGGIMPSPGMSNPETDLEYKWLGGIVNAMRYILPAAGVAGAAHRASQMSQPDDHLQATKGAQEKAMGFFKPATEQPQPQQFNQGGDVQYANWGQAITGFLNRFGGGGNDVAVDEFSHTIPHDIAGVNSVGGQGENQARQWMNTFANSYADPMGFDSGEHISTHAQMMQDPRLQEQEKSRFKAEVAGMSATPENINNATRAYADRFGVSEMQAKSELGFLNDIPPTQLGDDAAAQMELDNMRVAQELGDLPTNEAPPLPEDINWGGGRGDTSGDTAAQRTQYNSGDDIWARAQDAIDAGASKEEQDALVEQYAARTGVSKLRARQELGFGHERGGKSHLEKAREVRQGMMGLQGGDVEGDARGRGLAIAQAGVPGLPEDVPTDAEVAAGEADAARRNVDARTMDSVVNPGTGTDEVQSFTGKGATAHQDRYSAAAVGTDDRPLIEGYNDYVASLPSSALPKSYEDWVSERQRFVERNSIRPGDASVVVDEFGGISRDLADGDAQITDAATAMDLTDVNVERNPFDTSWTPNEDVGGASEVPEPSTPPPETTGETDGDQGETGGTNSEGGSTTLNDDGSVSTQTAQGETVTVPADKVGKAAQWFKDNVPVVGELIGGSGLLNDQALKQMATMYIAQRMLGYSHGGSLNWAAKNYMETVGNQQKLYTQAAASGKYTKDSLAKYKQSGDAADLQVKPAEVKRSVTGNTKTVRGEYDPKTKSYKKEVYQEVKIGDNVAYIDSKGNQVAAADIALRTQWDPALYDKNSSEYRARRNTANTAATTRIKNRMETLNRGVDKADWPTLITADDAAQTHWNFFEKMGMDPASDEALDILDTAFEAAHAEARSSKTKPRELDKFLKQQFIRHSTGHPDKFITNQEEVLEDGAAPEYIRSDFMAKLNSSVANAGSLLPATKGLQPDHAKAQVWKTIITAWDNLGSEGQKTWNKRAGDGQNGLYKFAQENLEDIVKRASAQQ